MFRRNDESEWTRFSKAFPATSKEEKAATNGQEAEPTPPGAEPTQPTTPNGPLSTNEERPIAAPVSAASPRILAESSLPFSRAAATAPVFSDEVESIIGPSSVFDGICKSESGIRVHGTAKGELESTKAVYIEENAKVAAKVTASHIVVAGEVNGELCCSGRVEIKPSGRVTGTINAGTLVMQEGAYFDGNLKMKTGEAAVVAH